MAHLAASINGVIAANASHAGTSSRCTASGASGEDTASVRGPAAVASRGSIASATIRRRRTVAITALASASNTAAVAPKSARQVAQTLGTCFVEDVLRKSKNEDLSINWRSRNKTTDEAK